MQNVGGLLQCLARLVGVLAVDQYVAAQPEQLAEQRDPAQALLADGHGALRHHLANDEQVEIGLVVGDDDAPGRVIEQRADFGL
ncbi:hypothetical protein D3C72_2279310 [compost metagenome]